MPIERPSGSLIRVTLTGLAPTGEATAEYDGLRVRAFGGLPGEEVLAEVLAEVAGRLDVRVAEVMQASPYRIESTCPYFGNCTGCQWQNVGYDHQLHLKNSLVEQALVSAGFEHVPLAPIVPARNTHGYRNHARLTVGAGDCPGFVNRLSNRFVAVSECRLMHPLVNGVIRHMSGRLQHASQVSIRCGIKTREVLIQPALGDNIGLPSGQPWYHEVLCGRTFRISSSAFFQVNTEQAERLVSMVRERLDLNGRGLLVDAYAGVGTFAALFSHEAGKVIAIEDSSAAVQDALLNTTGLGNVTIAKGKVEDVLGTLEQEADLVLLDPSRRGCHPAALQSLLRTPPKRVIYVACEPSTLARDLKVLTGGGYILEEVAPIDLFPHTHHVECVATLKLDCKAHSSFRLRKSVVLASASPRRKEIMAGMGMIFTCQPACEEEPVPSCENPVEMAVECALHKARSVASTLESGTVVGADTIVVLDNKVLGKPASDEEAIDFLRRLRGKEHRVITGMAVIDAGSGKEVTGYRRTRVFMRKYADQEILDYVATGDARDKAGAYAIQDEGFHPVKGIKGCYLNVVGLPPCVLMRLLQEMGLYPEVRRGWKSPGNCPDCKRLSRS